jgi:hypothetical protein
MISSAKAAGRELAALGAVRGRPRHGRIRAKGRTEKEQNKIRK